MVSKNNKPKYGVRIYKLSESRLLIKQTIKSENGNYIIDRGDEHRERHVKIDKDAEIAAAVRDGFAGILREGKRKS